MHNIIIVFIGGGLGAISRFGLVKLFECSKLIYSAPGALTNIMLINILGSFLFGLFLYLGKSFHFSDPIKLLLFTGFLSSFTTYSTFIYEFSSLLNGRNLIYALGYVSISIAIPVFMMLYFLYKI